MILFMLLGLTNVVCAKGKQEVKKANQSSQNNQAQMMPRIARDVRRIYTRKKQKNVKHTIFKEINVNEIAKFKKDNVEWVPYLKKLYKEQKKRIELSLKAFNEKIKSEEFKKQYTKYMTSWAKSWAYVGASAPGSENKSKKDIEKEVEEFKKDSKDYDCEHFKDYVERQKTALESELKASKEKLAFLEKVSKSEKLKTRMVKSLEQIRNGYFSKNNKK